MVVTNLAGEVVAANQATVQLFGYDQNQYAIGDAPKRLHSL